MGGDRKGRGRKQEGWGQEGMGQEGMGGGGKRERREREEREDSEEGPRYRKVSGNPPDAPSARAMGYSEGRLSHGGNDVVERRCMQKFKKPQGS